MSQKCTQSQSGTASSNNSTSSCEDSPQHPTIHGHQHSSVNGMKLQRLLHKCKQEPLSSVWYHEPWHQSFLTKLISSHYFYNCRKQKQKQKPKTKTFRRFDLFTYFTSHPPSCLLCAVSSSQILSIPWYVPWSFAV